MKLANVEVGKAYTYFPGEGLHFPALVEKIGQRRVRVRVFMEGAPAGVVKSVSARSLADQLDLFSSGAL